MYTTDQRIFIVETYIRKRAYAKCRDRFIRKYPHSPVPTKSCVSKLIKKWRTTGSVLNKTRHRKKTVLTDENLEDIRARLEISPRKSLRRLWPPRSLDLSVCDFYLWENLKGKVYRNTPRTAAALQHEIMNVVASISADELQRFSQGFLRRCEACLRATGNHFEHFL
jgi:hypothetical protein